MTRYAVAWVRTTGPSHRHDSGDAYVVTWPPVWTDDKPRTATLLAGPYNTQAEAAHAFLTHPPAHRELNT